jgi:hypothetical protein
MSARTKPPFRADHVGSLLRPPEVLQAREDRAAGTIDDDALQEVEDAAIRDVIRRQEAVGLQSITDGEFRRESWHMDFIYALGGITKVQDDTIHVHFENAERQYDWGPPSRCPGRSSPSTSRSCATTSSTARRSSRSRRRAWSTTAAGGRRSTRPCTRTSTRSGPT